MRDNIGRRISTTLPGTVPGQTRLKPEEVSRPIFDKRYMSWRLVNPAHRQALDPDLDATGNWPRQQADSSCNLIQLYEHIEYYIIETQTTYFRFSTSRVICLPFQEIIPEVGWQLYDKTTDTIYTVAEVLLTKDGQGKKVFDGRILLAEETGPEEGHSLVWVDPYGESDGKVKVIRIMHAEDLNPIVGNRASTGDVAEVDKLNFTPIISYSLVRKEPGSTGSHPFGPSREIKPKLRHTVRDPDSPDIIQKIYGQWFDTIVAFKVYATSPKVADRVALWLEQFFMRYNGVLMQLGVQQILPWNMRSDKEETRTTYDLSVRTVEFFFRLEEIQVELLGKIRNYNLNFTMSNEDDPRPWFTSEAVLPPDAIDTSGFLLYGSYDIGDRQNGD